MKKINYNSVTAVRNFLETEGLSLKKRFGQNFLISPSVRQKICDALELQNSTYLWEIGPGIGSMTAMCLNSVASLTVFELDYGFVKILNNLFSEESGFILVPGNFSETGVRLLELGEVPDCIMGNLPYSSGSAMVYNIIETGALPDRLVFTLQREVVQRITARPGSKDYSLFSVVCGFAFHIENLGDIAPGSFYPAPEVVSTIIRLTPHRKYDSILQRRLFFSVAKSLFASRRKTIKNNLHASTLAQYIPKSALLDACSSAGVNPADRGEKLSVDAIFALTNEIERIKKSL